MNINFSLVWIIGLVLVCTFLVVRSNHKMKQDRKKARHLYVDFLFNLASFIDQLALTVADSESLFEVKLNDLRVKFWALGFAISTTKDILPKGHGGSFEYFFEKPLYNLFGFRFMSEACCFDSPKEFFCTILKKDSGIENDDLKRFLGIYLEKLIRELRGQYRELVRAMTDPNWG